MPSRSAGGDTVVGVIGEVHTGLLQHSEALVPVECERLLALLQGERVRTFERPIAYTTSPELPTGVDCQLVTASGTAPRGVGSAVTRTAITGGRILQTSTVGRMVRSQEPRRLPWAHYLVRPGQIEIIGKAGAVPLAHGFLYGDCCSGALDLAAIAARAMDAIQGAERLDRKPPMRIARTKLRWAAIVGQDQEPRALRFAVERGQVRTVLLYCRAAHVPAIAQFCEDLAIHDWLLTALLNVVRHSRLGCGPGAVALPKLRPAVDHLLHLWMPSARTGHWASPFWDSLEYRPGLSRQWRVTVDRIRDQLALGTVAMLAGAGKERGE